MTTGNFDKEYCALVERLRAAGDAIPVINPQTQEIWCGRPPTGWKCTREPGHEGPCAASQVINVKPVHVPCKSYTDYDDGGFGLYREQREAIDAWQEKHDKEKHMSKDETFRNVGAIGGAYTYEFTGTSLGQIVHVRCACGETIDVTDYDQW